jgi:galactokinase
LALPQQQLQAFQLWSALLLPSYLLMQSVCCHLQPKDTGDTCLCHVAIPQVAELLQCSQSELLALLPPALQAAAASFPPFHLQQRALHVFSESQRVLQFKQVCEDDSLSGAEKLSQLGGLMDASHASCAGLYGCSCAELDALVGVAKGAGALGARLTGETL